jgi:hypothetical protein
MSVVLVEGTNELVVSIRSPRPQSFSKAIAFPHPFSAPNEGTEIVLPYQEGLLIRVDDAKVIEAGGDLFSLAGWPPGGLSMPWFGMTDQRAGMLSVIDTPFDTNVRLTWDEGRLFPQIEWEPSFGEWKYPRRVIYSFHQDGGHVHLAKEYRRFVQGQGRFRSLRDKARNRPQLNQLLGSPQIWPWKDLANPRFIEELKAAGIERATLMLPHRVDEEATLELLEKAHQAGYLIGRYDNYNLADTTQWRYRSELDAAKLPTGQLLKRSQNKTLTCGHQAFQRALLQQQAELERIPYDVQFMDTLLSQRLRECWDPAHPVSRTQDAQLRTRIMAVSTNRFNQVTGSEDGIDYAFEHTDFLEGPMTLHRFVDRSMKRTVWEEPDDSTDKLGTTPAPGVEKDFKLVPARSGEIYERYGLSEVRRAPLLELVYHDSVSTTYHWRWSNMRARDVWWKADLFNILYGTRPMWFIDRDIWDRYRSEIVRSYEQICDWHRAIALDELVDHQYLTDDRTVQQTAWSSGRSVVVNFGEEPFKLHGIDLAPRSYRIVSQKQ